MAQQLHRVIANGNAQPFDMRALRRLAIWGVSASAAVSVAVLAGSSNPAAQRLLGTFAAAIGWTQHHAEASPALAPTQSAEADIETRRLADAVRALAADRDELLTRISSIEQSLEDITGSISRQAASASLPPPPATDAPIIESAPVPPPAAVETVSPPPSQMLDPISVVPEAHSPPPNWVAALPGIVGSAETDLFKPRNDLKSEFGIDIGGAVNFDALRVLWNSTKASHAALLDGLSPRVTARENSKTRAAELRLIVGPLPDAEAATRLCATLSAARRSCQPAPFAGQRFALFVPALAAVRKPVPQPARQPARATP